MEAPLGEQPVKSEPLFSMSCGHKRKQVPFPKWMRIFQAHIQVQSKEWNQMIFLSQTHFTVVLCFGEMKWYVQKRYKQGNYSLLSFLVRKVSQRERDFWRLLKLCKGDQLTEVDREEQPRSDSGMQGKTRYRLRNGQSLCHRLTQTGGIGRTQEARGEGGMNRNQKFRGTWVA